MITYCPRCGAQYREEVAGGGLEQAVRCRDCGLTAGDPPAMLAPGPDDDEVEYDLGDWPVAERGAVTAALANADIPYRWEAALALVVPTVAEDEVDLLLDELDEVDELSEAGANGADDQGDDGADGGEEAQAAMADLFVAADRLQHAPDDANIAADVTLAASVVRASAPPYGIDRPTWRQIQSLATAVVGDLEEGADEELVVADAQAVRDYLRDFV